MLGFFRDRKRKLGCVTLLMACVFTAVWIFGELQRPWHIDLSYGPATRLVSQMSEDWIDVRAEIPGILEIHFGCRHWPISIYLSLTFTLLSVWLLLSKSREKAEV